MTIFSAQGYPLNEALIRNYFKTLVNHFFKIIPLREDNEESLPTYMEELQKELIGLGELIPGIGEDPDFLSLLSVLQYLICTPDCKMYEVKRKVFSSITVCNRMQAKFLIEEVSPQ